MKHLNLISIGIIGLFLVSSCSDVVHRVGTVDFKQSYDLKHKGNGTEIMSDGGPLFVIDTLRCWGCSLTKVNGSARSIPYRTG